MEHMGRSPAPLWKTRVGPGMGEWQSLRHLLPSHTHFGRSSGFLLMSRHWSLQAGFPSSPLLPPHFMARDPPIRTGCSSLPASSFLPRTHSSHPPILPTPFLPAQLGETPPCLSSRLSFSPLRLPGGLSPHPGHSSQTPHRTPSPTCPEPSYSMKPLQWW